MCLKLSDLDSVPFAPFKYSSSSPSTVCHVASLVFWEFTRRSFWRFMGVFRGIVGYETVKHLCAVRTTLFPEAEKFWLYVLAWCYWTPRNMGLGHLLPRTRANFWFGTFIADYILQYVQLGCTLETNLNPTICMKYIWSTVHTLNIFNTGLFISFAQEKLFFQRR